MKALSQQRMVAIVVEQEGIVPVRGVNLGVAHTQPVIDQGLDELARTRRRDR
jgi:hypothetical protein